VWNRYKRGTFGKEDGGAGGKSTTMTLQKTLQENPRRQEGGTLIAGRITTKEKDLVVSRIKARKKIPSL
jgi:hypothetical protein